MGKDAPGPLLDSLLYTLSYHRFGQLHASGARLMGGFDRVRREEIGRKDVTLSYFQEVYTTTNWLVRVYKVLRCSLRRAASLNAVTELRCLPEMRFSIAG